jgi:hypothetical protein
MSELFQPVAPQITPKSAPKTKIKPQHSQIEKIYISENEVEAAIACDVCFQKDSEDQD